MKIALLNDTHFGARNDSNIFDEYFYNYLDLLEMLKKLLVLKL